jgi:hypothetical protein
VSSLAILFVTSALVFPVHAQTRIELRLDSVFVSEGQQARMPVYLANYFDTLGGIQLFLRVDRPGICSLMTTIDTAGSLLSGWPYIKLSHVGGSSYNVSFTALASAIGGGSAPPLAPQAGQQPLFYLTLKAYTNLNPLFDIEAHIDFVTGDYTLFGFSTPHGELVGMTPQETVDTLYYQCLEWDNDVCLSWQQVQFPPYDSMQIVIDTTLMLDTVLVKVTQHGYVGIVPWICGDYNGDQNVNLTDVTLMVNYLFSGGPPPSNFAPIDVASPCEFQINLTDLTLLVNRLFLGGAPLSCCSHQ